MVWPYKNNKSKNQQADVFSKKFYKITCWQIIYSYFLVLINGLERIVFLYNRLGRELWCEKDEKAFRKTVNRASKFTTHIDSFDDIFLKPSLRKISKITWDPGHPLNSLVIKSSRRKRLLAIPTKSNRHLDSFIPYSVRLYNSNSKLRIGLSVVMAPS